MKKLPENAISSCENTFTEEYISELSLCTDPTYGFLYFAEKFAKVFDYSKGIGPFDIIQMQKEMMENIHHNQHSINMVARPSGKTLCAAVYLLWKAMFFADTKILVASVKTHYAQDIIKTMAFIYENCPEHIRPKLVNRKQRYLGFDNGSSIIAEIITEATGRGRSIDILYCDEFAHVSPKTAEYFLQGILPVLTAINTKIVLTSSPNSENDPFMQIWNEEDSMFSRFKAVWYDYPGRDTAWKNTVTQHMGPERFKQEFECSFS